MDFPQVKNIFLVTLCLVLAHQTAFAQTSTEDDEISALLSAAAQKTYGCTAIRKKIRRIRADYPDVHFAFAGRSAPSITGIKGCGYSWADTENTAQAQALERCKNQERRLNGRSANDWQSQYGLAEPDTKCRLLN
jgi:hypothetical protein